MDLRHITASDWAVLEEKYPDASSYLLRCSLIGEWEDLLHYDPKTLNDWQIKRLNELDALFANRQG